MNTQSKPHFSVVVPVFNEKENIPHLHSEIDAALSTLDKPYEIIFVDDGSTDGTYKTLTSLKGASVVKLRKNYGQSSALDAGIKQAKGEIIVTLDGDGQNDPADIPSLISKLDEGYDVVCGWRYERKDSTAKRFVSKGAAFLRKFLVDDGVHDAGCTLRAYKSECFEDLDLYGEMHRMIPALMKWRGFRVTEVKANHRPRMHGSSKYSWDRVSRGFLDMLYVWFWRKYAHRPLHLFGGVGIFCMALGGGILALMVIMKLLYGYTLSDKIWPMVGFVFILIGLQLVISGLLAANLVESSKQKKYYVERIVHN